MKTLENISRIEVNYLDQVVGHLAQASGRTAFQYDKAFLDSGLELSPVVMPLGPKVYVGSDQHFDFLPPLFADSLPDKYGQEVMRKWFFARFDMLLRPGPLHRLAYVGANGMGALSYNPAYETEPTEVCREFDLLIQQRLSKEISSAAEKDWIELKRRGVHTVGGSYPKVLAALNPETNELYEEDWRLPDHYSHWIIKFGIEAQERDSLLNYPEIEGAYLKMAGECGIQVPTTRMFQSQSEKGTTLTHLGIERFDRVKGHKRHMASLAALSGIAAQTSGDYRDFFTVTNELTHDMQQIGEVFSRMAFNVVMLNLDDHFKNHAFLMDEKGEWKLSPAFDLTYSGSLGHALPGRHKIYGRAMTVAGKPTDITRDDMFKLGERAGLSKKECNERMERVLTVAEQASLYLGALPEAETREVIVGIQAQVEAFKR